MDDEEPVKPRKTADSKKKEPVDYAALQKQARRDSGGRPIA